MELVAGGRAEVTNKIIVSIAGEDEFLEYAQFGLSFQSSEEDILNAIRPLIREKHGQDLMGSGQWLYKTRKATSSQNIHVIPNSTAGSEHQLSYLDDHARLRIYETIVNGCHHLWSKNKLQEAKLDAILKSFSELAEKDPLFLAHFTSYCFKNLDSKDLKVVATFMSSLSDADGAPFEPGSEYKKPNLRVIAQAAFCELDPKLALRVLKLANSKRAIGSKTAGTHMSKHIKTAAKKYVKMRESNPKMLEGIKKAGLSNTYRSLYRIARVAPSPEAVQILRWKQKAGFPGAGVEIKKSTLFDFTGMSDLEIAQKIRTERLKPQAVLGALPDKLSPVVAAAILEQCSGDQAVVYTSMFEDQGLLKHEEVRKVYDAKIRTAKQALDRVERVRQELDQTTKKLLESAKADVRKEQVGDIGKVFVHLDISGSMTAAIDIGKNKGAIIAECVKDPSQNFYWGTFNTLGTELKRPDKFTKAAFMAGLYGVRPGGGTDCLALFKKARELGCDTDIYITDGQHTQGDVATQLRLFRQQGLAMPRQVVIVKCGTYDGKLEAGFQAVGIPVSTIAESQLTESALVTQSIKAAVRGAASLIDDIMKTPLIGLPRWWESVK
jgi:hypothetical protein